MTKSSLGLSQMLAWLVGMPRLPVCLVNGPAALREKPVRWEIWSSIRGISLHSSRTTTLFGRIKDRIQEGRKKKTLAIKK